MALVTVLCDGNCATCELAEEFEAPDGADDDASVLCLALNAGFTPQVVGQGS